VQAGGGDCVETDKDLAKVFKHQEKFAAIHGVPTFDRVYGADDQNCQMLPAVFVSRTTKQALDGFTIDQDIQALKED